ncbi:MAG: WYL domain-containing protein [Bacteroidales bacterium]|nr:WYL domain-containing protein [Bacteroidales bacterium]
MVSELLNKYIWLVQTFLNAGERGLDLGEVQSRWERRWGEEYSRRTFCNHREAIAEVFGIEIECNRSDNRYFIRYGEDVSDSRADAAWLINTFTVNSLLTLGQERLSGRVSVQNIPSGQRWLTVIMEAMTEDRVLKLEYRKYQSHDSEILHVSPYAVKEFERRWYLAGWCRERDGLRVYGLDRIVGLEATGESFVMPEDFDVDEMFSKSYGIYLPGDKPAEEVVFRATEREAAFLEDLPLHHSQARKGPEMATKEFPAVFGMKVVPNVDLVMDFCRLAGRVEVLEPKWLRDEVAGELEKAMKIYK